MRQRISLALAILIWILGGVYYLSPCKTTLPSTSCAFCNPSVLSSYQFYEDELVRGLCTYKPVMPGHCLIIPKRHVERFEQLTEAEIAQIGATIKKIHETSIQAFETASYLLLQKNGAESGQTVPHVHFHYVPRKAGDDSMLKLHAKAWITTMSDPLPPEELQKYTAIYKEAMKMYLTEHMPNMTE